jgi:predicted amidohydrolase
VSASQKQIKVAIIQINSGSDKAENLEKVETLLKEAIQENPDLICLPEVFNHRGKKDQSISEAEKIPDGKSTQFLSNFAKENKVWVCNGSIFEDTGEELPFNTSILINDQGEVVEKYRKNHLFKASFKDKEVDESAKSQACIHNCVAAFKSGFRIGMSICYDLRFPELYRDYAKQKAEILLVPSSFARKTGEAHWETLLRARAIENQAYVIAANQWGTINGLETYGHSMIIDPWGKVLAQAAQAQDQVLTVSLDMNYLNKVRQSLPALEHMKV